MKQDYNNYKKEDFQVWKILYERQKVNLLDKASINYIDSLNKFGNVLVADKIPDFNELNKVLYKTTGWTIEVVPGLIPPVDFFEFLSNKKFCSSTWLRKMHELDYLEEPDMFHDIFGHIPLLMEPKYGEFMENMGKLAMKYKDNEEVITQLQRLYWFTIEFGLIKSDKGVRIYGAGVISSFGETNHVINDDIEVLPFNISEIYNSDFINSEIQTKYFELDSFDQLYESMDSLEEFLQS